MAFGPKDVFGDETETSKLSANKEDVLMCIVCPFLEFSKGDLCAWVVF